MQFCNDYVPSIASAVTCAQFSPKARACLMYVLVKHEHGNAYRCYKALVELPEETTGAAYQEARAKVRKFVMNRGTKVRYDELKTVFPAVKEEDYDA